MDTMSWVGGRTCHWLLCYLDCYNVANGLMNQLQPSEKKETIHGLPHLELSSLRADRLVRLNQLVPLTGIAVVLLMMLYAFCSEICCLSRLRIFSRLKKVRL